MKAIIQVLLLSSLNLIVNINFACSQTRFQSNSIFEQEPLIEAFSPSGLRVSISSIEGIKLFQFYFKVDKGIYKNERRNVEFLSQKVPHNGRLIAHNEKLRLQPGSTIYYWIRIVAHKTEFAFSARSYTIKALIPRRYIGWYASTNTTYTTNTTNTNNTTNKTKTTATIPTATNPTAFKPTASVSPVIETSINQNNIQCTPSIYAISKKELENINYCKCTYERFDYERNDILRYQWAAASLRELILYEIGTNYTSAVLIYIDYSGHRLYGKLSSKDFLIHRFTTTMSLYDLPELLLWAKKSLCGIKFEMASIVEKKRIQAAVFKKKNGFTVVDPDFVNVKSPCKQYYKY